MLRLKEYERVVYEQNPLDEVVCQVRFPRLLSIESKPPEEFQNLIRETYPLLEEEVTEAHEIKIDALGGSKAESVVRKTNVYFFQTADRRFKVSLGSSFISLTTNDYQNWDEFQEHLQRCFNALDEVYKPSIIERIGLRYIDVIQRDAWGLSNEPWSELLEAHICGLLACSDEEGLMFPDDKNVAKNETFHSAVLGGAVTVRHGLVQNKQNEVGYLIDSDFYTTELKEAKAIGCLNELSQFNANARNLFRWCIKEKLHNALLGEG